MLVMTSDFEGTPNVILEAMASGVPVVAYRTGGVPEIVQHGQTGYVLDMDDEGGMLDCISTLITDADLRASCGTRARAHMEANYAIGRLPAILADFYRAALA